MDWLKQHSYLATWLSPCIAIIMAVAKSKGKWANIDWHEFLGLLIFCTLIAVALTPTFDTRARDFAQTFACVLFGYGVLGVLRRKPVDNSTPKSETLKKPPSS